LLKHKTGTVVVVGRGKKVCDWILFWTSPRKVAEEKICALCISEKRFSKLHVKKRTEKKKINVINAVMLALII